MAATDEVAVEQDQEPAAPVPAMQGTFALFHHPSGGMHLSFRAEGAEEDQHISIPPMVVALAAKAMAGERMNPLTMAKALMDMR